MPASGRVAILWLKAVNNSPDVRCGSGSFVNRSPFRSVVMVGVRVCRAQTALWDPDIAQAWLAHRPDS